MGVSKKMDSAWIQKARAALGLTQEELASALGVDRSMVGKWEAGVNAPRLANARKIEALLESKGLRQTPVVQQSTHAPKGTDDMEDALLELFRKLAPLDRARLITSLDEKVRQTERAGESASSQGAAPLMKG